MDKLQEIKEKTNKEHLDKNSSPIINVNYSDIHWLVTEIEELREERGKWYDIIQSDADKVKRYEHALSKIMNTQCVADVEKNQYKVAIQIANEALGKQ